MFFNAFQVFFLWFLVSGVIAEEEPKPHIVVILADDLGINDVGFHGAKMFPTPNIDALAYNGVIMNNFYSHSLCTPSRSALMTGKFAIFTGMQHYVIADAGPWGLPLELRTLPQYLKGAGYHTHLVGKWHLGFFRRTYTPNYRGFDSFFGYYQGHQDYFTHRAKEALGLDAFDGYDLHENNETYSEPNKIYGTDLYTQRAVDLINKHDPSKPLYLHLAQIAVHGEENPHRLQALASDIDRFNYIKDPARRTYAAMVYRLDECVGQVVEALGRKRMLQNSIIIFMSDNGGPTVGMYGTTASNYPFRGMKGTELEGGTHLAMAIWSPLIKQRQRVSDSLMHMVDVLPTLCAAAGVDLHDADIDGINMWDALRSGSTDQLRTEFPYNIDPSSPTNSSGAVRVDHWKYYRGNNVSSPKNDWLGREYGQVHYPGITDNYTRILESVTYKAIIALDCGTQQCGEALTVEKIKYLRKTVEFECPSIDHLPLCNITDECLFDLKVDPCERYNVAGKYPEYYQSLKKKYEEYRTRVVAPRNQREDKRADPSLYGGEWVSWYDLLQSEGLESS